MQKLKGRELGMCGVGSGGQSVGFQMNTGVTTLISTLKGFILGDCVSSSSSQDIFLQLKNCNKKSTVDSRCTTEQFMTEAGSSLYMKQQTSSALLLFP